MVRGRARSPKIGLFQAGSHRIVDTPHCRVHHPRINEVAAAAKRAIRASDSAPYADLPHTGLVRALQVVVERESQSAQVVVVANDAESASSEPLLEALLREAGDSLHSLWWNGNPERSNVILGSTWRRVTGPETVREELGGVGVHFPPGAFGQSHLGLADDIGARLDGWVPDGARVLELYAGVGAWGLRWLGRTARVVFNERAEAGLAGLARGLSERPVEERARAEIAAGDASSCVARIADSDVVVVDPPRRGLAPELVEALCSAPPSQVLVVSCGLDAFEAEARSLVRRGGLELVELAAYDLFPFTEHVETVARFRRP